ncbi:MAG: allophanate hydrolase subunit 2 family protein, partial [Frankiales bacterium]
MAADRAHLHGAVRRHPRPAGAARGRRPAPVRGRVIVVVAPGPLTTVQDLGRPGLASLGVPPAGAVDRAALRAANRLVGNAADAAGLETTLAGPTLRFESDAVVAVAGGRCEVVVGEVVLGAGCAVTVRRGEQVRLGPVTAGLRSYLAVRGGIDVPPVLGSRSTCTLSGLGPAPLPRSRTRSAAGPPRPAA